MNGEDSFIMHIHRGFIMCPQCKRGLGFGMDVVGKDDITCPNCKHVFSYDDGFVENITDLLDRSGSRILFSLPICAGVIEIDSVRVKVGEFKEVLFKTRFFKVYDAQLSVEDSQKPVYIDNRLILNGSAFVPTGITEKGFYVFSSSADESNLLRETPIKYVAIGRDSGIERVPIWHKFLQNVIDLIRKKEFGMAIVQTIATFDAFFDDFLTKQLKTKRNYDLDTIKNILEKRSRRDKLYYYLHYVTGQTFEDSPYDEKLKDIADLRDKIAHPKEYKFNEAELTEQKALESLETVIRSIKWVNDTKR
jgi:hypothetical protein